ncbi:glutathione peroxidase [Alkalicoccus urumqiensis]|uniref:Glutathione peroxidase n=1 Tax=Alkalicoccus urumqiensis TaxID=1548213 RepID=A0A2P6MDY0_ALKUR|nr:glutathione peroxidase [Alkalicoccus urumqiensis]PRO64493.1 glutathione peroxidase [Alkalicoccus urumqiensis]
MSVYDFKVKTAGGLTKSLERYKGKVLLIVNTATKCGFTPQLDDLQKLQERYQEEGLQVLAFPSNQFDDQEPLNDGEITEFCALNYGVNFPVFKKIDVRDKGAHPLFTYLTSQQPYAGFNMNHPVSKMLVSIIDDKYPHYMSGDSIKWNFTKFLVDREGNVTARYESTAEPLEMEAQIKELLAQKEPVS